jgi:hypothetical protein
MLDKTPREMAKALRRKVGPVGLSLVAAALTAAAFAAVSVAADDKGGDAEKAKGGEPAQTFEMHVGPPPELSDEDEAALEEFRSCMEENGAPAPPKPGEMRDRLKEGDMPEPPSEADIEKIREAHEACEDKLPEGMAGGVGCARIGPGPGGPPPPPGIQQRDDGEPQSGVQQAPEGATS